MRWAIEVAYDGTNYHGWQVQPNGVSVQEVLQNCLTLLLREPIEVIGSGRTDTGVHATGQVAHFNTSKSLPHDFLKKINSFLPPDISILQVASVPHDFHARFSAIRRYYIYQITQRKDPFLRNKALFCPYPLDLNAMQQAASFLLNYDDFQSFCKAHADNEHYLCKIYQAEWKPQDHLLTLHIQANRFLRGMVRAIVGTLLEVGKNKLHLNEFCKIIEAKDRRFAKANVSPSGLFLKKVIYPSEIFSNSENF